MRQRLGTSACLHAGAAGLSAQAYLSCSCVDPKRMQRIVYLVVKLCSTSCALFVMCTVAPSHDPSRCQAVDCSPASLDNCLAAVLFIDLQTTRGPPTPSILTGGWQQAPMSPHHRSSSPASSHASSHAWHTPFSSSKQRWVEGKLPCGKGMVWYSHPVVLKHAMHGTQGLQVAGSAADSSPSSLICVGRCKRVY